jgi:alanine dehydrogenase
VTHYCVANMPGAVPRTSTFALTNATLPFVQKIAEHGLQDAARGDASLRAGINIVAGAVTHDAVARSQNLPYVPLDTVL